MKLGFTGRALNAVDAKGRVSLPASFRLTVERKLAAAPLPDGSTLPRAVLIGPHERESALHAFDMTHVGKLQAELEERIADLPAAEKLAAREAQNVAAFSTVQEIAFDSAGRMVLPAGLRRRAGIGDLAYFVAAVDTFQIWDPERYRLAYAHDQRQLDLLDDEFADRAARGKS